MAAKLIEREQERIRDGVSLRERKELYEKDNLGALRLASKGCAIDPNTATWDCPVFCDLPAEEQLEKGLYLMGQVVSLMKEPTTIAELHTRILEDGLRIFESRPVYESDGEPSAVQEVPAEFPIQEVVHPREPIAVVGIGLRLPGADSPSSYWEHILSRRSGIVPVPEGRWESVDFYYDPDPKTPDKTYSKIGGFLTDFVFDPLKYRIPPAVAQKMDLTQQLAVTCVASALEDAGLSQEALKDKRVGIILGNSMGGETSDRYALRVDLPRTVHCLQHSLKEIGLDDEACRTVAERFSSQYLEGLPAITEDSLPGELANVISGRVANVFNLEGPNFTVDAACASSMAAVMNAISELRDGTIDLAVTGGVDAAMNPASFVKFCKIGALSPDGSRPFDEGANGFVMGEGAGVMILKRYSDAMRDGDRIYGTILEIGSSSDGRGKGITAPNAAGQQRAVRACLAAGGIDPATIDLIEAHGTSTAVGDKIELMVLDSFFREVGREAGSVGISSVKSQIGHLKAAAGSAAIIKVLLGLHNKTLPPTINVKKLNPCIDWESSPLFPVLEPRAWDAPNGRPRRAGVSSFGFGGTNFHVVVQEHVPGLRLVSAAKQVQPEPVEQMIRFSPPQWPRPPKMQVEGEAWVIGAPGQEELELKIRSLTAELNPENAEALAARHRDEAVEQQVRCGFAARDASEAIQKLELILEGISNPRKQAIFPAKGINFSTDPQGRIRGGIAFIFPGQGSQYPFMLRDLADRFPSVAETFEEADEILGSLGLPPITQSVFPASEEDAANGRDPSDALKDTQLLQPLILTANTAILRLLESFGIRPSATAGHSLGEYSACVAGGVFSFRDALEAVAVRGREMARVSIDDPGLMMSIPADARLVEDVLDEVDGYVVAANKNSPKQTVISGETAAVKQAAELFKARGIDGIILPVSAAFHSGVVAPAREPFMKTLNKLRVNPPTVPILSNVTGDYYPLGPAAPEKIRDLLGKQFAAPVEWVKSLRRFYNDGIRVFLECGPKRVMTNLTMDTLGKDVLALPTNHPKKGGILQILEAIAALAVEGQRVDFAGGTALGDAQESVARPELRVVSPVPAVVAPEARPVERVVPGPLEGLVDEGIKELARQKEFARYLELQGEPIRKLIKAGYETFVENILPMERTVRQVKSQGMDFQPVVISGLSAGLPSDVRFPFDKENLDDLILGRNFIKKVSPTGQDEMLSKNVERLFKGPSGEAELRMVEDVSGVIKLAGSFVEENLTSYYGLDEKLADSMDITTRLAIAAGIEALRDAGIPLILQTRVTSTGHILPESWALPEPLRHETGIIFASAFPGLASLVDEVSRETASRYGSGARKRLIDFYSGLVGRIRNDSDREAVTRWFTEEFNRLNPEHPDDLYAFNRSFLLRVMVMGHGQFAQFIKATGPNTHVDAACASTTQAVLLAKDWIRTGQAKRVVVIGADDVAGRTLLPWIGSGFLAMGAATTEGNVSDAALPFDNRRHGLILGSAAVGLVVEKEDLVRDRGMEPIASVEAGVAANSAYHGTRLNVEHISSTMKTMMESWEKQSGLSRDEIADQLFFMSHETYSPKRGGSSAAEMQALRDTFGDKARMIPVANTKGFTGHTMGVGVEDVVALRCLQRQMLPPIPNLKQPDPDFADLNLSRGGAFPVGYALRLAAGFGSQIVMCLFKAISRDENRISDLHSHRNWLKKVTGYSDPVVTVEDRTLRVAQAPDQPAKKQAVAASPSAMPEKAAPAVAAAVSGGDEDVREKILALLSDKTGYPSDMLDTGLDLEADLGIDTVKQAEFISEVREAFDIPRIEGLKIADFPTIEHIINFVMEHTGRAAAATAGADAGGADQTAASGAQEMAGEVEEKILALLSDKTGYPADMLDTDLDLEADLGIDTVKQAEFITEVREAFNIPRIEGLKIADFPTIKHIIQFVIERSRSAAAAAPPKAEEKTSLEQPAAENEVRLYETRLVTLRALPSLAAVEVDEVFVAGGPDDLAQRVAEAMAELGNPVVKRISESSLPEDAQGKRVGVVNLFPMSDLGSALNKSFGLYLSCATLFDDGPAFLVTAVSEDGAFGFEEPIEQAHIVGCINGATKSFGREYPETRTRLLDFNPGLDADAQARTIVRSLKEGFPLETGVGIDGVLRIVRLIPSTGEISPSELQPGDVVLATGGARGITAACLKHVTDKVPLTIVIFDLSPLTDRAGKFADYSPQDWTAEKTKIIERLKRAGTKPTPVMVERELGAMQAEAEVFRTVRDLRSTGSEVMCRAMDIRDKEGMDAAVREVAELCGRVDMVIHGAGIDISRALKSKTVEQMEMVVSVKVDGMVNLLESLQRHGLPPRRIVGFGSVSGRFGNLAQTDYSAANDGLAHMLRRADRVMDGKASTIGWSPWADIGMATRGSVQQTLEAAGIDFVPPQTGVEFLRRELLRISGPSEVLAAGRVGPFTPDAFEVPGIDAESEIELAGQSAQLVTLFPGTYLKARISLDPGHAILNDHRIDRAAVLPGVGGLEIMRSAARLLDPDLGEYHFEGVGFKSPLKIFGDTPFEAEVEISQDPDASPGKRSYRAKLVSWFVDKQGRRVGSARLHHECLIVPGAEEIPPPEATPLWERSIWIQGADIYSVFFHGPGFQFLDHVVIEGDGNGIRFLFRDTAEREAMFTDAVPGAVEAAFQAAAALAVEARGLMALPTGIEKAVLHSPGGVPGEGILKLVRESKLEGADERQILTFDGVIKDMNGNPMITLTGVEAIELADSSGFPGKLFQEIVKEQEIVGELDSAGQTFLETVLTGDEAREFSEKKVPKRAHEWVSGRVALKRGVKRLLAASGSDTPSLNAIRIVSDEMGKPSAELTQRSGEKIGEISLSHSNGFAVAVATEKGTFDGVGIDIEKVEERNPAWVEDYFNPEEISLAGNGNRRWTNLARIWSLKEAVLKAAGTGLRFDLKDITVESLDPTGKARISFHNEALQHLEDTFPGPCEAHVEEQGDLVIARVFFRKS